MKKLFALVLAVLMMVSMIACAEKAPEAAEAPKQEAAAPAEDVKEEAAEAPAESKYASYPETDVRLCVPVSSGGNVDNFARISADYFRRATGEAMTVENLNTGSGILCYETVREAEPDGYTLMMYNPSLFTSYYTGAYNYSPIDTFTPICTLQNKGGSALVVRADSGWESLDDLVAAAQANPGTVRFGMQSKAAAEFICKLLEKDAGNGCEFKIVDAGSNNDRTAALLGGMIDVTTQSIAAAMQYQESGDFRVLCITDTVESPYAPGVKTAIELGYPSVIYGSQAVLYGPKDMDPELVARISEIFSGIMDDAEAIEQSEAAASPLNYMDVEKTIAEVQSQNEAMQTVADMLGYEYGEK